MADISAIFGILIIFGITFPGMLTTWRLLFPAAVERARTRLEHTPWQCFWLGGLITGLAIIPILILFALPFGATKFLAWMIILVGLTISSLGSAGIAARMGVEIGRSRYATPTKSSNTADNFLRAAVLLELAVFFPLLGWLVIFPITVVTALGAAGFALLNWAPKTSLIPAAPEVGVSQGL